MKKILKITNLIGLISLVLLTFYSCNKNDDLVTKDAPTGGLVVPQTTNVPYKLGNTPSIPMSIVVPQGPGISKIEVYITYFDSDTAGGNQTSNRVLFKTIDINGANASKNDTVSFNVTYADLSAGIILHNNPLPVEADLHIGSSWTLEYITYVDGRKVTNVTTTIIGVANLYAGNYHVVGYFTHPNPASSRPIDEDKFLSAVSAYSCEAHMADLYAAYKYTMTITVNPADNSVTVKELGSTPVLVMSADSASYFDPATGKFHLHYFYVGAGGNRVVDEHYTPLFK